MKNYFDQFILCNKCIVSEYDMFSKNNEINIANEKILILLCKYYKNQTETTF